MFRTLLVNVHVFSLNLDLKSKVVYESNTFKANKDERDLVIVTKSVPQLVLDEAENDSRVCLISKSMIIQPHNTFQAEEKK